ncbi:MAG: hypothetical protein ACD_71C00163G0001 [uncultured bacterium (gcode 4)]|uniref:Transposase IS200-like domain-containing protein n=1 Tax=uncultured bacterium (gcode 4) TaxID=1234023 RepID=K1Z486_9BACT|nr:MAG: hypothetical protein ACD_71C00163G0001 [uncultured bacterium (gcode 4)]
MKKEYIFKDYKKKAFTESPEIKEMYNQKTRGSYPLFHITWVTHSSRISERMMLYKVEKGEWIYLSDDQEVEITRFIWDVVRENHFQVLAYNICKDHVHILLVCKKEELPDMIRKLKWKSAQKFKEWLWVGKDEVYHLWAQKYNISYVENNEKFREVMKYIEYNRVKHWLSDNKGLQPLVHEFLTVW